MPAQGGHDGSADMVESAGTMKLEEKTGWQGGAGRKDGGGRGMAVLARKTEGVEVWRC